MGMRTEVTKVTHLNMSPGHQPIRSLRKERFAAHEICVESLRKIGHQVRFGVDAREAKSVLRRSWFWGSFREPNQRKIGIVNFILENGCLSYDHFVCWCLLFNVVYGCIILSFNVVYLNPLVFVCLLFISIDLALLVTWHYEKQESCAEYSMVMFNFPAVSMQDCKDDKDGGITWELPTSPGLDMASRCFNLNSSERNYSILQ